MSDNISELVERYKQWKIGVNRPSEPVMPKSTFKEHPERSYNLKNNKARKFLQHEDQTFGINLGWTDDAEPATGIKVARWFFTRNPAGKQDGPIRYGEVIALGNGGTPSFLEFDHRTVGINLSFVDRPAFQWKILGGEKGTPVRTSDPVALFNMKSESDGEFFIFFDRSAGGDIGWPSSQTWTEQAGDKLKDEARKQVRHKLGV